MKHIVFTLLLAALAAAPAHAGGINLSWDDCGTFGQPNRNFACDSNTGTNTLVASYEPLVTIPDCVGSEVVMDVQTAAAIPPWWQMFNAGTCRQSALTTDISFAGMTNCTDFWLGKTSAGGGVGAYTIGFGSVPNRARVFVAWAVPNTDAAPVSPGTQYYAARVNISNAKTVGAGSCGSCGVPACISLVQITLDRVSSNEPISAIRDRAFVTWQGGNAGGCFIVPVVRQTWGGIKTLYR
jgi:hypothetical protein